MKDCRSDLNENFALTLGRLRLPENSIQAKISSRINERIYQRANHTTRLVWHLWAHYLPPMTYYIERLVQRPL